MFVAGPRAYLAFVDVKIWDQGGVLVLDVPEEQAMGPWLFVDLPPGTYTIAGKHKDHPEIKKSVTLTGQQSAKVILQWSF